MKFRSKGLLKDKTAAGSLRWRVRVEGDRDRKITIPMGPGEPRFHEHYAAARAGHAPQVRKPEKSVAGTLDALCEGYLAWLSEQINDTEIESQFKPSPLTLKGYRPLLNRACDIKDLDGDRIGSLDADLPKEAFVHIRDSFGSKTGSADNCLKALRAAYRWGEERSGFPDISAIFDVKKVHKNRGGATPWAVADMRRFLQHHGPGTMARLWFLLSLNVLPRIGDVYRLGPEHILWSSTGDAVLSFQPSKKGSAHVEVPVLRQLLEELKLHPERDMFIGNKAGGRFASAEVVRNKIQDWTAEAGLPRGRTQHGIRKGAAELLAAAGATQYEIMALMSHTQAQTSEIYTRKVERAGLAARAIERISCLDLGKVDHVV